MLTFLKRGGINVDKRDAGGFTPLHYACKKGARDIVRLLIDNQADVNLASNTSVTPLYFAATAGNQEIIQCLLDAGADINATDKEGKSVLIYSVLAKKVEAAKYLLAKGRILLSKTMRTERLWTMQMRWVCLIWWRKRRRTVLGRRKPMAIRLSTSLALMDRVKL